MVPLLWHSIYAEPFPPPRCPYQVGITQHVFNHTTPNDPVAPKNASSKLLATVYCPTLSMPSPGEAAPYLDPITATPTLNKTSHGTSQLPTVILSPGSGVNTIMYNVLSSKLASQGYTFQLLYNMGGIYGVDITASWNRTLQTAVYNMRVSDALAMIWELYPPLVDSFDAPFNITHYFMLGHSIGGAAAPGIIVGEPSVLGGVNLDGGFFELSDIKKPILMIAGAEHTRSIDPTWSPFSFNQSRWWEWLNVTRSDHLDFTDIGDWVDLLGLRNKTSTPRHGPVLRFFNVLLGRELWCGMQVSPLRFPEVVRINASTRALH
ncbi:hypothetical protein K469DRAFT_731286 [Zopfia rhizophila CBS 207.26]|uniref:1-alkyl-2-acetylglycerophosphocholine esterase n=1 Tax=Zopfia rhizophila CBS 207.26 TaxID=1314779 RepID=A0A6A6DHI5_9PEZI|nr:hypothetical protein K469DRAFT_731286 [Zopfia rhizophila CBS 207.26]